MENKITLTDTLYYKLPYIVALCPSFLLIAFSRTKIGNILSQIPHDDIADFVIKYMQLDNHSVALSFCSLVFVIIILITSTVFLVKNFSLEDKRSKVLSLVLMFINMGLLIFSIIISKILFYIILTMIITSLVLAMLLGGFASSNEQ